MTHENLLTSIAAILTTALETEPYPFPESMAYLAMGSDIQAWETVRAGMVHAGLVTIRGYCITLTPKGRALAEKCNAAVA